MRVEPIAGRSRLRAARVGHTDTSPLHGSLTPVAIGDASRHAKPNATAHRIVSIDDATTRCVRYTSRNRRPNWAVEDVLPLRGHKPMRFQGSVARGGYMRRGPGPCVRSATRHRIDSIPRRRNRVRTKSDGTPEPSGGGAGDGVLRRRRWGAAHYDSDNWAAARIARCDEQSRRERAAKRTGLD